MELNSLLILLEAAEYLERRDREAEHGYASVLPYSSDFSSKKTKASPISRKSQNNRSSHNELEKHRRAKLRLYLEQLKKLVPLGPDSTRHTTLSLLKRARMHIKRWTSRAWSSLLERRTAWTASATVRRRRRRTTTASRAAPATPATQPHIPTDCSRTTVRQRAAIHLPTSFFDQASFPSPFPSSTICNRRRRPLPTSDRSTTVAHPEHLPPFPAPALQEVHGAEMPLKPS
ncbi:max dimerization protein 4 isoform X1 [Anarrhichthys ocellatus]|uniref:max dimerization protein 4 isoform X1 n=1 Tax=Anarrhichthys ocellatus TaxID=433405 RepID=UPI0012ED41A4|nr:max dimerization protein 4 isoform X1 [Anarrhichthys ocellatus]